MYFYEIKNFKSIKLNFQIKGPGINGMPILLYAPYVNNVTISIDMSIFTSPELIYNLTVYVGVDSVCGIKLYSKDIA